MTVSISLNKDRKFIFQHGLYKVEVNEDNNLNENVIALNTV